MDNLQRAQSIIKHSVLTNDKICRRDFCAALGLCVVGASGLIQACSALTFDPKNVDPEKFDIRAFDSWFKWNYLYTGINPNLRYPHRGGYCATFKGAIDSAVDATPGIDYEFSGGGVMVSTAPGIVEDIIELNTGRLGGHMVTVAHPIPLHWQGNVPRWPYFRTYYAHLDREVLVEFGQKVDRGTPIGTMSMYPDFAKIMFKAGGDWTNPDRYGPGMGFMIYPQDYDSSGDPPIKNFSNTELKEYNKRIMELVGKQNELLTKIEECKKDYGDVFLSDRYHVKGGRRGRECKWSAPEKFLYLEKLYEINHLYFNGLSKQEFAEIKSEFLANQPIVLTLPMVKK
jgi:hypothetical protein